MRVYDRLSNEYATVISQTDSIYRLKYNGDDQVYLVPIRHCDKVEEVDEDADHSPRVQL